jgi:hypothetical protein
MVVERFSQGVVNSGLLRLYVATGFFATLIFFVVNADFFTPMEMIAGVIASTIVFKSLGNMMLSLIISLFSLDNKEAQLDYQYNSEKIDALLSELTVKDAQKDNGK